MQNLRAKKEHENVSAESSAREGESVKTKQIVFLALSIFRKVQSINFLKTESVNFQKAESVNFWTREQCEPDETVNSIMGILTG